MPDRIWISIYRDVDVEGIFEQLLQNSSKTEGN